MELTRCYVDGEPYSPGREVKPCGQVYAKGEPVMCRLASYHICISLKDREEKDYHKIAERL